ncbi:hypothetical protein KC19_VG061400 [Ceratodon purpureus]|uniref:Uncharacterized protein n=1 Tax=Ceratodon purpureus TaxID=3225 RepID=A0A8T0HMF5_CERPU|nr:hypothetical protein KC19_VG061400 [Ceratodon purpureus]
MRSQNELPFWPLPTIGSCVTCRTLLVNCLSSSFTKFFPFATFSVPTLAPNSSPRTHTSTPPESDELTRPPRPLLAIGPRPLLAPLRPLPAPPRTTCDAPRPLPLDEICVLPPACTSASHWDASSQPSPNQSPSPKSSRKLSKPCVAAPLRAPPPLPAIARHLVNPAAHPFNVA